MTQDTATCVIPQCASSVCCSTKKSVNALLFTLYELHISNMLTHIPLYICTHTELPKWCKKALPNSLSGAGEGRRGHHQRGPQIILKAPHIHTYVLWREAPFFRVPGVQVLAPCWCGSSTHELVAAPRDLLQHFLCSTPAHPLPSCPFFH